MKPSYFSAWQRRAGWLWTTLYVFALGCYQHDLLAFLPEVIMGYPAIALRVACALWVWFAIRIFGPVQTVIGLILSIDCIAIMTPMIVEVQHSIAGGPIMLFFVLVLALLHLGLEPLRRRFSKDSEPG